ncbi:tetraspanin-13b isoform X2 [Trematomus bernacchii]|uniref:tetraspanin-13b isoform X2 n=1 Tax=Trematomus bernacchii TaxID=40690 RepID=UPI00146D667B|nr:tetraspanin-13b isoform X2 [Trematomus bernacchii]
MGCSGFTCSKHCLCALNILYVMVSLLMIGIAAWGKWFGLVSSFQVVGGIIAVGVFLFFVAGAGLMGAMKHHQVLLFFYMIVLFMVFIVQFSVSSACLAINREQQEMTKRSRRGQGRSTGRGFIPEVIKHGCSLIRASCLRGTELQRSASGKHVEHLWISSITTISTHCWQW